MGKISVFADRIHRAVERFDNWQNMLTGLGTDRDKRMATTFAGGSRLADEYCDRLYHDDDMASRICDTMPEEALRLGFRVTVPVDRGVMESGAEDLVAQAKEVEAAIAMSHAELCTAQKVADALVWANVFGGSALLLGVTDGTPVGNLNEPLRENSITGVSHLNVIDRRYMTPLRWYDDPTQPKFGTPATYMISPYGAVASASDMSKGGVLEVHETRMVVFGGVRTSLLRRQENGGWEDGLLQRVHTVLRQFGVGWDTLEHLMTDATQGVYKIHGLIEAIAAKDPETITKRMQMIDMARSVIRAVVLDAEMETFERQNFAWSGIKEPYELLMYRLAAAARIPATVLFGRSPAGMNATGDSDFQALYDQVRSYQDRKVTPALDYITRVLLLSKDGPTGGVEPENWTLTYPSLYQTTPKEQAEIRKIQAEADHIYITDGVVTADEIALSRFTADGWQPETTIDLSARLLREPDDEPEPVPPQSNDEPEPVPPQSDDEDTPPAE